MSLPVQSEMFQATAFDPPLRDNRDVMEYPFLSIQKGRRKPIEFTSKDGNVSLEVSAPEKYGIATIWDWDLMIYLSAQLNDGLEVGAEPSQWIEFAPYDALRYMGKGTGGKDYKELVYMLRRLITTTVITSVRQDDTTGEEGALRWIEDYRIPKRYAEHKMIRDLDDADADPSKPWRIKLPMWIYNAIVRRTGILAVHPNYFKLTGGLERWLYRLARKSVPDKADFPAFNYRMETLHKRSGSTRPLRQFAADVRKLAEKNSLPEYGMHVHRKGKNELVSFYRDVMKPRRLPRGIQDILE